MENILKIVLGEEYKIKVEKVDNFKESIFKELYKKAFEKTKEILESNGNTSDNDKSECNSKNNQLDYYNNIVAYVGERGTGKTSSMLSVSNVLKKEDGKEEKDKFVKSEFNLELNNMKKLSHYSFHSVGIIDPSMLSHNSNILEIVIAKMFQNFKNHLDSNGKSFIDEDKKRKLIKAFEEVFKNIKIINNKKDLFEEDALDALLAIAGTTDFKDHIFKLVKKYLEFMNSNCENNVLILEIDDIDLNTKYAYEMIEQIRKYFILPNVIIFMAVKMEQLSEIIEKQLATEFELMIKNNQMNFNTIKNMVEKYLEKLIPLERRLYLPRLDDINLSIKLQIPNAKGSTVFPDDIEKTVRTLIYEKTGMMFFKPKTSWNYIVPNNLRALIGFVTYLCNLKELDRKCNTYAETKFLNFSSFKNYFMNDWVKNNLNTEDKAILQELLEKDVQEKNKYTVMKLREKFLKLLNTNGIENSKDGDKRYKAIKEMAEFEENISDFLNNPLNISIGDVLVGLWAIERIDNSESGKKLVFAIKTVYSIMLYEKVKIIKMEMSRIRDKHKELLKKESILEDNVKSLVVISNLKTYINNYKILLGGFLYNRSLHSVFDDTTDLTSKKSIFEKCLKDENIKEIISLLICDIDNKEKSTVNRRYNSALFEVYTSEKDLEKLKNNATLTLSPIAIFRNGWDMKDLIEKTFYIGNMELYELVLRQISVIRIYPDNFFENLKINLFHLRSTIFEIIKKNYELGEEKSKLLEKSRDIESVENKLNKLNYEEIDLLNSLFHNSSMPIFESLERKIDEFKINDNIKKATTLVKKIDTIKKIIDDEELLSKSQKKSIKERIDLLLKVDTAYKVTPYDIRNVKLVIKEAIANILKLSDKEHELSKAYYQTTELKAIDENKKKENTDEE